MGTDTFRNQIYAGVLGKLIGVYLGRPVEGWKIEDIRDTFGEVNDYVHDKLGVPLIVTDDDISGTFAFFRALEDNNYDRELPAKAFGDTWLNYIIENKTILWWGGLGRSTEHTAYLNLKRGVEAPKSGSAKLNGQGVSEQIGAQIFIDAFSMACPDDPDLAVSLVRKAASVSHDGLAVDAACHLAALESMAFTEKRVDVLLDRARNYVHDERLLTIIADVRNICQKERDWRKVRGYLDSKYGYERMPGSCHMIPNHAMVLAAILLGGDDFGRSVTIAVSAGWDTDCNAGNVGAFNGIRLGLDGINSGIDYRTPVADRMYVVTADGGSVVTDAVIESKRIIRTGAMLHGKKISESKKRFTFEFPGALQGFTFCDFAREDRPKAKLFNYNEISEHNGLVIRNDSWETEKKVAVSTPTFIDFTKLASNFSTVASPTLYSSQKVVTETAVIGSGCASIRPYILYYDRENQIQALYGEEQKLGTDKVAFSWTVPDTGGMPIFKLGYEIAGSQKLDGGVVIYSIDWNGAPTSFVQKGVLMSNIWDTNPLWMSSFASSAVQFAADSRYTYCVSNADGDGLVTIGTREWKNYSISSAICYSRHKAGGFVARSRGHRRYYGAVLMDGNRAVIYMQRDQERIPLADVEYYYQLDKSYQMKFTAHKERLEFWIDGSLVLEARDDSYTEGAAGFIVSEGTILCDGLLISQ